MLVVRCGVQVTGEMGAEGREEGERGGKGKGRGIQNLKEQKGLTDCHREYKAVIKSTHLGQSEGIQMSWGG